MIRISLILLLSLFCTLFRPEAVAARGFDDRLPSLVEALDEIDQGRAGKARIHLARTSDRITNDLLLLHLMARPGNDYGFDEMARFIMSHPDWPGLAGIRLIAEQKIPSGVPHNQIINWFTAFPPLTEIGFARYVESLNATGQEDKAIQLVRSRWIERDFSSTDFNGFRSRYAPLLRGADHRARLDRLLWDGKAEGARQMYPLLGKSEKALAEARLALGDEKRNATKLLEAVPASARNDAGLLYERTRWRRKRGQTDGALEILENAPAKLVKPSIWWQERHILARHLMEKKEFRRAYRLVDKHGLSEEDGFEFIQAEFLAGWLALRFLDQPSNAEKHFNSLLRAATSPMSKARGLYWLGRTQEELNRKEEARQSYESAAVFNTTFYGQLAIAKLYLYPVIQALPEPAIPGPVRNDFFSRDVIQITQKLARYGDYTRAKKFFIAAGDYANMRVDFALLTELAHMLGRPDWAIQTAKKAATKGILLTGAAYPVLSTDVPTPPDIAFTHALIRQESMFRADAGSPAGARGLMQLMPATAKEVAKRLDVSYNPSRLNDAEYNLKLGTCFIQKQIDDFNGSYVLALAGYNAGPRRVREWVDSFGDPRGSRIDPVDWIELIPIYETRNYVQRILESLQFYRARLGGGQAPLTIIEDLKR